MFCTQKTPQELAEESRKATAEGMRQLAEAMRKRKYCEFKPDSDGNESDSSSSSSSSSSSKSSASITHKTKAIYLVEKLEQRIHYMKLDLTNLQVEKEDLLEELNTYKTRWETMKKIDNGFSLLKDSLSRAAEMDSLNLLTYDQLNKKSSLFNEEFYEHYNDCKIQIQNSDLYVMKEQLEYSLESMLKLFKIRYSTIQTNLRYKYQKERFYKFTFNTTLTIGSVIILYCLLKLLALLILMGKYYFFA